MLTATQTAFQYNVFQKMVPGWIWYIVLLYLPGLSFHFAGALILSFGHDAFHSLAKVFVTWGMIPFQSATFLIFTWISYPSLLTSSRIRAFEAVLFVPCLFGIIFGSVAVASQNLGDFWLLQVFDPSARLGGY